MLSHVFSKQICHSARLDLQLLHRKFHTKLTSFCWILAIRFGVHFLLGHSVGWKTVTSKQYEHIKIASTLLGDFVNISATGAKDCS